MFLLNLLLPQTVQLFNFCMTTRDDDDDDDDGRVHTICSSEHQPAVRVFNNKKGAWKEVKRPSRLLFISQCCCCCCTGADVRPWSSTTPNSITQSSPVQSSLAETCRTSFTEDIFIIKPSRRRKDRCIRSLHFPISHSFSPFYYFDEFHIVLLLLFLFSSSPFFYVKVG